MDVDKKREQEKLLLRQMISIYCRGNHKTKKNDLCVECRELLDYALIRADRCPFMETKTFCSACKVHCYKKDRQEQIRNVMRYSGMRMLYVNPPMAIKHVITTIKNKRKGKKENVS